ncbi:hypothetical protein HMPREF1624_00798 [Sporothrix schenckii ATCC 58251]|uniref:beta-mannosidase n=1 Tax=Sporothrix schenckii (strain ATCC 58251 / de Perez 2211183) TaxID=1391915 RepID=U7Q3P8_SPOS1|nr:hypothetical protein HMPREF1624_00798 [Sporothrix schenckii ATCC 58251]
MAVKRVDIDQGWEFKQASSLNNATASSFLPVAQFPTVAHIDLLHHKLIPDPYIDDNELACLWVNDADWTYRTTLPATPLPTPQARAVLVFEGLDTVVDVFLGGTRILSSKNMHVEHRVDVTDQLRAAGGPLSLELLFKAAPAFSRQEKKRIGYKGNETDVHFGGPERLFLRKAQYHWGWDWGPAVNTSGPWKPVYLEVYETRIDRLVVRQQVSDDLTAATISIQGRVETVAKAQQDVHLHVSDPSGASLQSHTLQTAADGSFATTVTVDTPQLWYPHMYGDQPLYTVSASVALSDAASPQDSTRTSRRIGLRRLRLLQHPLKEAAGTSFVFEVNNIRLFCGGSCWIPGDFMLPRMTRQRYRDWIQLAKDGHQSMIRVWGGGIVESDDFYDLCDEAGMLVWQDFLFACGNYPASGDFLDSVRREAEQQVVRVGHHASLALWAGNNEDYMVAERWGWDLDMSDETGPWDQTNFPAREIYERVLPAIVETLGGDVPYWRSSPYGGAFSNDTTVGDTHIWDVWHGKMSAYQDYKSYTSRFVSEFGFESCASLATMERGITVPAERHAQSRLFDIHDKGPGHARRYPMYMGENFRFRMNPFRDFVYCTQFLQAEALRYAYNCWRRAFRGPGEEHCAGVLVWQLNDIWPGTSWALVDVDRRPKPAYYITKRALAPAVVGMERTVTGAPPYITTGYPPDRHALDVWAVNGALAACHATLTLAAYDVETGAPVPLPHGVAATRSVVLAPNQTTELVRHMAIPAADRTVVVAYLDGPATPTSATAAPPTRLARWVSWPEPLRLVRMSPALAVTATVSDAGDQVLLTANAPTKGVTLHVSPTEGVADAVFDDNFVDLVPGETVVVGVHGLRGRAVEVRFLYDWELKDGFEL